MKLVGQSALLSATFLLLLSWILISYNDEEMKIISHLPFNSLGSKTRIEYRLWLRHKKGPLDSRGKRNSKYLDSLSR